MFVKLDHLYINTEKIDVIGVYEVVKQDFYETGLVVNGLNYCIYNVAGQISQNFELIKEMQDHVTKILDEIVKDARVEVKNVDISKIDVSKYIETSKTLEVSKKEKIND